VRSYNAAMTEQRLIEAVDLFCGVGGLTAGLRRKGIRVKAGYDLDPHCAYPYRKNNKATFVLKDVADVSASEILGHYSPGAIKLLAGCAPCQPFSTYTQGRDTKSDRKWPLLDHFSRLIRETTPHLVTMENVPDVTKHDVYQRFVDSLTSGPNSYYVWSGTVACDQYGLPQRRRRHVLLASALAPIALIGPTHLKNPVTVRDAIESLPPIGAGESDGLDSLHVASKLSPLNLRRIRASRPGGSWLDWPKALRAACHRRESGKSYAAVYGRMSWDEPAPTMTTLCYGYGNGRFGHPAQDRGISLREAAILQSFPPTYVFGPSDDAVQFRATGRLIGNAVPVRLGEVIGLSLRRHVQSITHLRPARP
jgi:DNA (cytosine-5)-methyltransferase 1